MTHYMDIKVLKNFVTVANTGSISQAAEICYISQPSLSLQMKNLEEHLGVQLFERTNRGVVLTNIGERWFEHAVQIISQMQLAVEDIKGRQLVPQGRIAIGMPLSIARFISAPLIEQTQSLYPKVTLEILEMGSAYVPEMLVKGEIDLGVTFKKKELRNIIYEKIMQERLGLLTPKKFVKNPGIGIDILKNNPEIPFIVPPPNHGLRDSINAIQEKHDLNLNIIAEINTISLLISLSVKGVCATILSYPSIMDFEKVDTMQVIKIENTIKRDVYLCSSALSQEALAVKRVKELMFELTNHLVGMNG